MSLNVSSVYLSKPWTAFYPENVSHQVHIEEKTVTELFDGAATQYADRTAIVFYGKKITYGQLREWVNKFASALSALDVGKGSRVGLYLLNSPQFVIAYFGALKIGAVVVPMSPAYTSVEIKHQLADSGVQVVVCQDILFDQLQKSGVAVGKVVITAIDEYLPKLKKIFGRNFMKRTYGNNRIQIPKADEHRGIYDFQTLLRTTSAEPPTVAIDPRNDLAVMPYTGGTTAEPKGVMLTHYNLVATVQLVKASWLLLEPGKEVIVSFLPLYHIYGQVAIMLFGSMVGATLLMYTTPDTEELLYGMERYNATIFFGVPSLYEYLKDHEKTDFFPWKKLKLIISGADTLHASTMEGWYKRTGTEIIEGYGMTETSGISHVNPYNRKKKGSFGIPIPNVTAGVIDPDTLESVAVGEIGELVISGPNIMQGYWNNEKETRHSLVEMDGTLWLRTGDLCRMDDEGYFYFYERKKDLIKYKGYSVFAREIEEVLHKHEYVKTAGVIGVPDPKVGNYIKANVVLHPEARGKITEEEIKAYCKANLAHYKVPHIVEFRGELPKTDVGKVSRRELREEHG